MLNYDEPNTNSPSDMPLSRWLDIWAEEFLCSVKPRTVQKYKCIIEVHLKPGLGDYSLGGLDTLTIQRFYNDQLYGRNGWRAIAPKTLKDLHGVLHSALQQAVDIGYIPRNPTKACKIARVVNPEISVLDSEQISDFLNVIKGNRFEILYIVTLFTGMRRAEVCGLMWDCVDFQRGIITVKRQRQKDPDYAGCFVLSDTKTGRGRVIKPAASVMELLKKQQVAQEQMKVNAGSMWQEHNFVFTNEVGEPVSPNTVYNTYKRLMASIGLPNSRMHDLRHSYAVASLMNGDDIKTVQENLGHTSASFTLDRYGHVTDQMRQASSERMEKFFLEVSGKTQ